MTASPIAAPQCPPRLSRSDRWQPLVLLASVGIGLAIGGVNPAVGAGLGVGVSGGVFILLTLVMLNVSVSRIGGAWRQRRFLLAATVLNFIVNPLLAWGLSDVFLSNQPELAAGVILFLVTPCIGWYLVFTELAGGDTELGVSLLGINVVLQILLLPVYLALFVGDAMPVSLTAVARSLVLYLVLPGAIAAMVRWWRSDNAPAHLAGPTPKTIALTVVIISMFASQATTIFDNASVFLRLIAPIVAFFVIAFSLALLVGQRLDLTYPHTALLTFTTTSRNSEASLAVAATAFASPLVGLTVVLGPVIELPLLVLMVEVLNRNASRFRRART